MPEAYTQLHLVDNLKDAFHVAKELGALGIGLDIEGVLTQYVGNDPLEAFKLEKISPCEQDANDFVSQQNGIAVGLMTNNTNTHYDGQNFGFVDGVSVTVGGNHDPVKFVHKGMKLKDGTELAAKPAGQQGKLLASMLEIAPKDMVLIDDQGVKNTGEAVKAGFKALIAPNPIGVLNDKGRIIEHKGVMRLRKYESAIYKSLKNRGNLAMTAFSLVAKIELNQISDFVDHRQKR